jgi:hypothetical protein
MVGSAADFAEERVTLDDISSCCCEIVRGGRVGSSKSRCLMELLEEVDVDG